VHHHHTGEDELIWPLLLARVDLEAALIDHRAVLAGVSVDHGL
jgi:hypothetical protein